MTFLASRRTRCEISSAVATTLPGYLHMRDLVGERDNARIFLWRASTQPE